MRVIIFGSREWKDPRRARKAVVDRLFLLPANALIVVGYNPEKDTPKGIDRFAYQEAQKLGFALETHPAEWETKGKAAGFIRNTEMAERGADLAIGFWNGRSNGTSHMREQAEKHGIPVEMIEVVQS